MSQSFSFTREFFRDRKQVGSVVPSGGPLASAMVKALGRLEAGQMVVELGPGTGVVTSRLEKAWPDNRLLTVEFLPQFAEQLEEAFPSVDVIQGCASELQKHLTEKRIDAHQVGGIVSSLPLLSLPTESRDAIFDALRAILQPGRRYIQFTYIKKSWDQFMPEGFVLKRHRRVWRNIPPATVLTFVRL